MYTLWQKELYGQWEYPLMWLHHKAIMEINKKGGELPDLNREIPVQFQKRFMMQPHEGVFFLSIQLFLPECTM